MKDILITGGAGKIGLEVVNRLVDTKCNITILELESRTSIKRLASVKNSVRIVYGDVEDSNLVRDLIKRNDIVIDCAGIMPPLAELNENIATNTNYVGTKNIVDAINELNPTCRLIYLSFICVYGMASVNKRKLSVDSESTYPDDFYSISILRSEAYIKDNLKDYTILRMPVVLTKNNYFIKHVRPDRRMDFITKEDMSELIVKVMNAKKTQGKTYNISGFKATGRDVIKGLYRATGKISIFRRNIYYGDYIDAAEIEKIVDIKYTSLEEFIEDEIRQSAQWRRVGKKIVNFIKYAIFSKLK